MPISDKTTATPSLEMLMGITGTSPTMGSPQRDSMVSNGSVAAALAVLPTKDGTPRVIQQFTSVFLVSRLGELWRVYDADDPDVSERQMPSSQSSRPYRLFIALASKAQLRVHTFSENARRDIDPASLQTQLDAGVSR